MKVTSSHSAPSADDEQLHPARTAGHSLLRAAQKASTSPSPALTGLSRLSPRTAAPERRERQSVPVSHGTAHRSAEPNPFLQPDTASSSLRSLLKTGAGEIAHTLENNGTGLLVHGSKPVWFIEKHDSHSGYNTISSLTQNSRLALRDEFTLIPLGSSPRQSPGILLVNNRNLLDLATKHSAYFIETLCCDRIPDAHQLVHEHIIPAMQRDPRPISASRSAGTWSRRRRRTSYSAWPTASRRDSRR